MNKTQDFISTACNPFCIFNDYGDSSENFVPYDKWIEAHWKIFLCKGINWEEVASFLKNMPYQDFLNTPYWKIISFKSRFLADFRCKLCNDISIKKKLHVHHRTYKCHGFEHNNLNDLVPLCEECHYFFHEILKWKSSEEESSKIRFIEDYYEHMKKRKYTFSCNLSQNSILGDYA